MSAFVAVCDAEGFAPAARRLGVSPSTITRLVGSLEERLRVRLLQRSTRSLSLTDAGRRYLEQARRILADMADAEEAAHGEQAAPRGRLTVTAPLMLGRLHVAPILSRFVMRHAALLVELHLNDRNVNLIEEGIDLAVRIGELEDSSLVARRLGETRRVLVASPAYLDTHGRPRTPLELEPHTTIGFGAMAAGTEWRFAERGRPLRVRVSPRFATSSGDVAIAHACEGGGLTFALSYQIAGLVAERRLEIVLAEFEAPALPIHAVYPSSRLLSGKVRAFIDALAAEGRWHL